MADVGGRENEDGGYWFTVKIRDFSLPAEPRFLLNSPRSETTSIEAAWTTEQMLWYHVLRKHAKAIDLISQPAFNGAVGPEIFLKTYRCERVQTQSEDFK